MRNYALLGQRCSRSTDSGIFISRRICRWRSSRGVMKKVASGKRSRVSRSVEVLVTDVAILPIVLPVQSLLIVGRREVGAGAERSAGLAMWLSVVHAQPVDGAVGSGSRESGTYQGTSGWGHQSCLDGFQVARVSFDRSIWQSPSA